MTSAATQAVGVSSPVDICSHQCQPARFLHADDECRFSSCAANTFAAAGLTMRFACFLASTTPA